MVKFVINTKCGVKLRYSEYTSQMDDDRNDWFLKPDEETEDFSSAADGWCITLLKWMMANISGL